MHFRRSKDIASEIPGEGIIAVLERDDAKAIKASSYGRGKSSLSVDSWVQWIIIFLVILIQTKVKLPSNAKVVVLKNSGHLGFVEEEELSVKILPNLLRTV